MRSFLKDIITQAGVLSLEFKRKLSGLSVHRKSVKDLVTEADVAVERFLVEHIQKQYPDHAILGEESGVHAGGDYRWIIDPIDGTGSFVHDQPFYSISVALEHRGTLILGAVNTPVMSELFMAEKGKGAARNGQPIHVSQCESLIDAMVATGFACMRDNLTPNNLLYVNRLLPQIRDLRRTGSAALDLCYVACGRFDGFWELNLKPYDIAAGMLIVQEAGGIVTDFDGGTAGLPGRIIAAAPKLHPLLQRVFHD